jgi:biotin synthase
MLRSEILNWLKEEDAERLKELGRRADAVRRENVGDEVHLRGLIEFSNFCARQCTYCGIRANNRRLERYRMTETEIMDCVRQAVELGYGTVVLQSGEDYGAKTEWLAGIIRRIKAETPLAVTLSLSERPEEDLVAWRAAGADRYLLRFETSNKELYDRIHPPLAGKRSDRIAILRQLQQIGYETGSGVMIGIPGQRYGDLADDIEMFRTLDLDMIGVGPYIPHPGTPLGEQEAQLRAPEGEQAPNTEAMTYKVIALSRIVCPKANIPSTTALATLNTAKGRELGLMRGANVIMPNVTPPKYRALYEIYPSKACIYETPGECHACLRGRILAMGRRIGTGRGDSKRRDSLCADKCA